MPRLQTLQGLALEATDGRSLPKGAAALLDRLLEGGALPETFPWQLMGCDAVRALQPALLPLQVAFLVLQPTCAPAISLIKTWRVSRIAWQPRRLFLSVWGC